MKKLLFTTILLTICVMTAMAGGGNGEETNAGVLSSPLEGYSRVTDENLLFDFQWKIDGDKLNIQLTAPTTGWVSVGFDATKMMADADILIGYVSNGTVFLRDDFGDGQFKHSPDTKLGGKEHYSDLKGEEIDGTTRIRFTIPLDSGDAFDKPLKQGGTYKVIYAYGPNGKDDFGSYHAQERGSFEITL